MSLNKENISLLKDLRKRWYFSLIESAFQIEVNRHGLPDTLNYLTVIMRATQQPIEQLLDARVSAGKITDKSQSRVSVAGNGFQALVALALIECQRIGLLDSRLVFVLKPKNNPLTVTHTTISVFNEVQKPDLDLLVYCNDNPNAHLNIFSIKTSLRERVGQTYRWKLLLDLAMAKDCQSLRTKYGLKYRQGCPVSVSLITADFYNEASNPQQRGAFAFFDGVYITRAITADKLTKPFSSIVNALNCSGGLESNPKLLFDS